ncbi:MAG: hypothetical protein ACYDGR_10205 [Candidatus Dormibacteria bacterium]
MTDDDADPERGRGPRRRRPGGRGQTPSSQRPELLRLTRDLWEPRYGRRLSDEEAREILTNMTGFCRVLLAWSETERDCLDRAA